jgi:hypothetical protein
MRRLAIVVGAGLFVFASTTACAREVREIVVVTATPAGTPTLTAQEEAYIQAVTTQEAERATLATVAAEETKAAQPTSTPRPPPYKLALISSSCTFYNAFRTCEGFVKNITSQPVPDVMVVILWLDDTGLPADKDQVSIDFNPLLPGQQSHWGTFGMYNPAFTQYKVQLTDVFGRTILTRDDRQ